MQTAQSVDRFVDLNLSGSLDLLKLKLREKLGLGFKCF